MKIEVELMIGNPIQVNDVMCLPIIADYGNGRCDFLCRAEILETRDGYVLGFRLDGDHFETEETLLKHVLNRVTICLKNPPVSWD